MYVPLERARAHTHTHTHTIKACLPHQNNIGGCSLRKWWRKNAVTARQNDVTARHPEPLATSNPQRSWQ